MATDGLHWTIAIALYLFGSFLAAMGINSMKLALDRDEEARAAGKTEPLLSDGSSASDSTSGGGGYGTLESGGDEELLGGSAPVVKPSAFEAAKATVRVALLPRRDRCRCCCASAYDCLDAQAGAVLDVVMWLLRLFPMLWYVGLGSLLMGQVFVFPSFSLANQSVLCTLGSVQFPLNLLFVIINLLDWNLPRRWVLERTNASSLGSMGSKRSGRTVGSQRVRRRHPLIFPKGGHRGEL